MLCFRLDNVNQVTRRHFPATCQRFIAQPNQCLPVISSIILPANRVPALLKYILISLLCGSFIGEVNIPKRGWQRQHRCSALTLLQFPPHLISTRLHSTRESRGGGEEEERGVERLFTVVQSWRRHMVVVHQATKNPLLEKNYIIFKTRNVLTRQLVTLGTRNV